MTVQVLTDDNFDGHVANSPVAVLVDFWAPWCGPCRMLTPIVEELAQELDGKVKIAKMNIDENPITPTKFQVRSIPTLLLFKDGRVISTQVGAVPKSKLLEWINVEVA